MLTFHPWFNFFKQSVQCFYLWKETDPEGVTCVLLKVLKKKKFYLMDKVKKNWPSTCMIMNWLHGHETLIEVISLGPFHKQCKKSVCPSKVFNLLQVCELVINFY